jgi:hypothetical protein
MAGIEPATDGLRNRCSTTELHWLKTIANEAYFAVVFRWQFRLLNTQFVIWYVLSLRRPAYHHLPSVKRIWFGPKHRMQTSSVTDPAAHILGASGSMAS